MNECSSKTDDGVEDDGDDDDDAAVRTVNLNGSEKSIIKREISHKESIFASFTAKMTKKMCQQVIVKVTLFIPTNARKKFECCFCWFRGCLRCCRFSF